jgi:hypothetical protein
MNRLFDKKPKKLSKSSRRHLSLGIPTNIAVGPLGFQADLDVGPKGECTSSYHDSDTDRSDSTVTPDEETPRTSRIVFRDKGGENQELPAPEASTSGVVEDNTEHGNELTSASVSYHPGQHSRGSLCLSPPEENAGDTRGEEGESAVAMKGACRYHCVVHFLLTTSTSSGDRLRGHGAGGSRHSHRCREGGHSWIRSSQDRLGGHLRLPSSLTTPYSKLFPDKRVCRKRLPSETRSRTSSGV